MDRHAEYFAGFVSDQSLCMQGPDQLTGFSALENEFDTNIKAAWDWLVAECRWSDLIENMLLGLFQFGWASWKTDALIPWLKVARLSLPSELTSAEQLALAIFSTLGP